jgi:hypothetical protein
MRRFILVISLGLAWLGGCGHAFEVSTPPGFVELKEQQDAGYAYRATSADGLVIAVRQFDNDPKGEISFWEQAIENQLRQRAGYSLLDKRDAKSADGTPGRQLRFGHDEGKTPHLYYVTLFVNDRHIYLIEQGGTKELVEAHAADLDGAVTHFRVK